MPKITPQNTQHISPEATAYWYFRLNGCLQIQNFYVHPDPDCPPSGNQARTDADLIGVRMPWRNELDMEDDDVFHGQRHKILIYLAEVKTGGYCEFNGPWSKPTEGNMQRALAAIGCIEHSLIERAASALYGDCCFEDSQFIIRMAAFGNQLNPVYLKTKSRALQITWDRALRFIHRRYQDYRVCKANHEHWPEIGETLWKMSDTPNTDKFVETVIRRFH